MAPTRFLSALLLLASLPTAIEGGFFKKKHRRQKAGTKYNDHDAVHVVVNKVGPFNNPTETYRYYSLPFCHTHADHEEHEAAAEEELPGGDGGMDDGGIGDMASACLRHQSTNQGRSRRCRTPQATPWRKYRGRPSRNFTLRSQLPGRY
mmetsp:Transcript_25691/g.55277  ORF Transcript_25691/g.55277 Transcript_25691/m.55277 type:complete len:149 (-) Transcript_25691:1342-1788(-)